MITGWLFKLVLSLAVIGFLAVEAGSPVIVRAQVDGAAHDAADAAAAELLHARNADTARAVAEQEAADEGATLDAFEIDGQGVVHVTLVKEARSVLFKKWSKLANWYRVRISVTSAGRGK